MTEEMSIKEIACCYRNAVQTAFITIRPAGNEEVRDKILQMFVNDSFYQELMKAIDLIDCKYRK